MNRDVFVAEALVVVHDEPLSYSEAIRSPYAREWRAAMDDEYQSLMKNRTWEVVELPPGCKPISCRWVYKVKERDGKVDKFKARLVARGFTQ